MTRRAPRRLRPAATPPAQAARPAYQRGEDTPLLACATCRANYLNDPPSRAAHKIVFGHRPRPSKPEPKQG